MSKKKDPRRNKAKSQGPNLKKKTVKVQTSSGPSKAKSSRASVSAPRSVEFTLNAENFKWMGIGILLIVVGMILMSGGSMPSPDVWDENIIYGFRRTVLAPILILAGLGMQIFGIFKK